MIFDQNRGAMLTAPGAASNHIGLASVVRFVCKKEDEECLIQNGIGGR